MWMRELRRATFGTSTRRVGIAHFSCSSSRSRVRRGLGRTSRRASGRSTPSGASAADADHVLRRAARSCVARRGRRIVVVRPLRPDPRCSRCSACCPVGRGSRRGRGSCCRCARRRSPTPSSRPRRPPSSSSGRSASFDARSPWAPASVRGMVMAVTLLLSIAAFPAVSSTSCHPVLPAPAAPAAVLGPRRRS